MANRPKHIPPLERVLDRIRKQETTLWGKLFNLGYVWLARVETHPVVKNYGNFSFGARAKNTTYLSEPAIDLNFLFVLSLIFHLLLLLVLARVNISSPVASQESPVVVRFVDSERPAAETEKEPVKKESQRRAQVPTQRRLEPQPRSASLTPKTTEPAAVGAPAPLPILESPTVTSLPGPKILADASSDKAGRVAAQPVESLVQLPTRSVESAGQPSASTKTDNLPGISKESGSQLPAALQRGDPQPANRSVSQPQGSAISSPDFAPYLKMIETRVKSVWKYPPGLTGIHRLNIVFVLDKSGNLMRAEIVDTSDPRLNTSAVQAIRMAAPFPPIPATLKELAGEPLRVRFNIDFGIK
ncbi:MAG: TonB C-terminal domain-containing protein [Candidatus Binatia bacterium]